MSSMCGECSDGGPERDDDGAGLPGSRGGFFATRETQRNPVLKEITKRSDEHGYRNETAGSTESRAAG